MLIESLNDLKKQIYINYRLCILYAKKVLYLCDLKECIYKQPLRSCKTACIKIYIEYKCIKVNFNVLVHRFKFEISFKCLYVIYQASSEKITISIRIMNVDRLAFIQLF